MSKSESPLARTMSARDVSVTERAQFRSCRRRWMLETLWNWTPKQPKVALMFGDGIHQCLETYYEAMQFFQQNDGEWDAQAVLMDMYDTLDEWHATAEAEQAEYLGPLFTVDAKEDLYALKTLGVTMLTNYVEFAEDKHHGDPWEIVAVEGRGLTAEALGGTPPYAEHLWPRIEEGRVVVPIVDPDTGEALPGDPLLSGRIDILVRRGRRGDLYVVDHKTTAAAPSDRGLDFEDQITGYSYIVWRMTGIVPRGTIFNYLVKNEPKDPRILKATKQYPDGKLSTAKDQLCLARDYRKAMIRYGYLNPKSGVISDSDVEECYAALINKGWDPYFKRFDPTRNTHEVMMFERHLVKEVRDMTVVAHTVQGHEVLEDLDEAYPNLSTMHCTWCSVAPICQAMNDGSDWQGVIEGRFMQAEDRKATR